MNSRNIITILCIGFFCLFSGITANAEELHNKISLDMAINLGMAGNIELQETRRNLNIAKNEVKIANSLKNPSFQSNFLMGKVTRGNSSQFGLMLPVEIMKRGERKKSAQINSQIVEQQVKQQEFDLKLRIRTAYFNLLKAKTDLKIMEERKELLADLVDIAKNKPKNAGSYKVDLLQADMRYKKQLIEINKAKANIRNAQYTFNRVLNLEDDSTLYDSMEESLLDKSFTSELQLPEYNMVENAALNDKFTNLDLPDYEIIEGMALKNRYDIKIAQNKVEKTKKDLILAKRKRIPDVQIGGGYAYQTSAQTKGEALPGAFVGFNMEIPLLYQYTPDINNAKLNHEKAELDYNSKINITKNTVKTNYDKFIIAQENVSHYQEIINESEELLKLSKQRYKKGEAPLTSLIITEHSHQTLLNEYISAVGVYFNSYIALLQIIGLEDLNEIL